VLLFNSMDGYEILRPDLEAPLPLPSPSSGFGALRPLGYLIIHWRASTKAWLAGPAGLIVLRCPARPIATALPLSV